MQHDGPSELQSVVVRPGFVLRHPPSGKLPARSVATASELFQASMLALFLRQAPLILDLAEA
jgi:hypothetical protein